MSRRDHVTLLLVLAGGLAGCGGSLGGAEADRSIARAAEPRASDPTAAAPAAGQQDARARAAQTVATASTSGTSSPPGARAGAPPERGANGAAAAKTAPTKIGARHILVQWMGSERAPASVVRAREQALVIAQEVLRRARAGQDFPRLAVEFSDEPGAGPRGGSLGRFGKGQMVPAFEDAAFKLEVGEISDIVESGFGFHVIQRTE